MSHPVRRHLQTRLCVSAEVRGSCHRELPHIHSDCRPKAASVSRNDTTSHSAKVTEK